MWKEYSVDELEQYAGKYLSSFEGNKSQMSNFVGDDFENNFAGDDFSSNYDGGSSTFEKAPSNFFVGRRTYIITITNSATDALSCYVLPGLGWYPGSTTVGFPKTGAFKSISNADGLSGAGSPKSLEHFYDFIRQNPTEIVGFKISSNVSSAQMEKIMIWQPQSAFNTPGDIPLILGTAQTDMTERDKIAGPFRVPADLAAAGSMRAELEIEPKSGSTNNIVTLTFYGGLINSSAVALVNRANRQRPRS